MSLLRIAKTRRTTDNKGNLSVSYVLEGDATENVESIQYEYTQQGERLPQIGEVNKIRKGVSTDLTKNRQTYVDKVSVAHDGKDHQKYTATVSYVPPEDSKEKDDDTDGPDYPWNDLTDVSQTGDVIMEQLRGVDKLGNPSQYSNGEPILLESPTPITIYTFTRKVLSSSRNSFALSNQFDKTVNSGPETVMGVPYEKYQLFVQSFDVSLQRFKEVNEDSGVTKVTEYQVESVVVAANKGTWKEFIVDEGNLVLNKVTNSEGVEKNVYAPFLNKTVGNTVIQTKYLNGNGWPIFDEEGNVLGGDNTPQTSGKTPQGVPINEELSKATGDAARVVLEQLTYEPVSFSGLKLNEGF